MVSAKIWGKRGVTMSRTRDKERKGGSIMKIGKALLLAIVICILAFGALAWKLGSFAEAVNWLKKRMRFFEPKKGRNKEQSVDSGKAGEIKDLKERAEEKGSLYSQMQVSLAGPTGVLAAWGRMVKGIEEGNASLFATYAPVFLQNMEKLDALFEQYQNLRPLETDPKDSIMTAQLNGRFEDEALLKEYSGKAKVLKESGFLKTKTIDQDALLAWYQRNFGQPRV